MVEPADLDPIEVENPPPGAESSRRVGSVILVVATVATIALVANGVAMWRLVHQGDRIECADRANGQAGLADPSEPAGSSARRAVAQRYADCFDLADASRGTSTTTTAFAVAVARCPGTEQPFELPPSPDESGDGLPPAGSATLAAARRTAVNQSPDNLPKVVAVAGRAWSSGPGEAVEIKDEQLYTVEITLRDLNDCPQGPVMSGVPIIPFYVIG